MFKFLSLELILFLGFTIFAGLVYLLMISYRSRKKDDAPDDKDEPDDSDDDPAWRAKRFWWFGR